MADVVIAPDLREYVDDSGYGIARYRGGEWPQDWSRTQLLDLIERVSKAEQENVALRAKIVRLEDVEKAIRKTGERYPCISGGWASFAAQVCSEIAPKPSLAAKTGGAK